MRAHVLGHGRKRTIEKEKGETVAIDTHSTETMDEAPQWQGAGRTTAMLYFLMDVLTFRYCGCKSSTPPCTELDKHMRCGESSRQTVEHVTEEQLLHAFPRQHPLLFLLRQSECIKSMASKSAGGKSPNELLQQLATTGIGLDVNFAYDKNLPQWQRALEDAMRMLLSKETEGVTKMSCAWHVSADALRRMLA
jgi:hypothetical protein